MRPQAHIDLSWTKSITHRQICEFKIIVSEFESIVTELTPEVSQVLRTFFDECSNLSVSFSFADLRSMTRGYNLCEEQVLNSHTHMRPTTVRLLVDNVVDYGMKMISLHGEDDINIAYFIDAMQEEDNGIEDYARDENEDDIEGVDNNNDEDGFEDYDMYENEDDIEGVEIDEDDEEDIYEDDDMDDEPNLRFIGVEEGRYDGGDGKEVTTCSVCLEDLSSGMEFKKLSCSHTFHNSCIDHWLRRNRSCPNCRTELTKLEERDNVVIASC